MAGGPQTRLEPGVTLGRFTLTEKIALGGMAEIWTATDQQSAAQVGLKILAPAFANEQSFRAMFQDEVNIASRLTHENIVQVYGAHQEGGHFFQAMELIEGLDLRRLLSVLVRAGAWFPIPFALLVAREVARALSYAHLKRGDDGRAMGVVHRDVSPHNIMITKGGRVKLLDFGIAKATERLARTKVGIVKGKISYMAPEQALAVGVTPQTDIFATGVVLWEMLAMRRLFTGIDDSETLALVVKAESPPILEQNPEVPPEAAELVHKMLAQRAANRPESMREVETAINKLLARHFPDASHSALAEWVAPHLSVEIELPQIVQPPKEASEEISLGSLDPIDATQPTGQPDTTAPDEVKGDVTLTMNRGDASSPSRPISDVGTEAGAQTMVVQARRQTSRNGDRSAGGRRIVQNSVRSGAGEDDDAAKTVAVALPPSGASIPAQSPADDPTPAEDSSDDDGTDRVRMPTKSEIHRAVDRVATVPVRADMNLLQAVTKMEVPDSFEEPPQQRTSSGPPKDPAASDAIEAGPPNDSTKLGPLVEAPVFGDEQTELGEENSEPEMEPLPVRSSQRPPEPNAESPLDRSLDESLGPKPQPLSTRRSANILPVITVCLALLVVLLLAIIFWGQRG